MRVLGIDPGTAVVGYAVIEDGGRAPRALAYGVVRAAAPGATSLPDRLRRVFHGLLQVIREGRPDAFAIESAFVCKNARSALKIGEGRAAAILAAAEAGLPVFEYAPALVKRAVTGTGAARKAQVAEMMRRVLGLSAPPRPADAADALAVAFCHLHRARRMVAR